MNKLTQEQVNALLTNMLEVTAYLTQQFLIEQEKNAEWESASITLEHLKIFQTEFLKLQALPEFIEYGFDNSHLIQAIDTDFARLEHSIKQHEASIQNPRAQAQRNKILLPDIKKKINNWLLEVRHDEAHLIPEEEVNKIKTNLDHLKIPDNIRITLDANLRIVQAQIIKSHLRLADLKQQSVAKMSKLLKDYCEALQSFHSKSKKPTSKEIGATLLNTLKEVMQELQTSPLKDQIKSLHKADSAIEKAFTQREIQQSKSKSRAIFTDPSKVTLEKALATIKKSHSTWQELLASLEPPAPKLSKPMR